MATDIRDGATTLFGTVNLQVNYSGRCDITVEVQPQTYWPDWLNDRLRPLKLWRGSTMGDRGWIATPTSRR
ncbi:Uncharacterized protein MLTONO_7487 [Mesorhizobium loti]|nr:Uncharacterized protein MLTONO_7487 [Mesorhizobium loti]